MRLSQVEREFIDTARVARLATVDPKGAPHNVPICPLLHDAKIYFGTEANAKKVRNLKTNPQVAIVFDDYSEAWAFLRGVMIRGRARVVDRPAFRALRKKLYAKYPRYATDAPLEENDAVIVEIVPQVKFTWGLK